MTYNEIVDLLYVQLVEILLHNILADGFIAIILLKVSHLCIRFGVLNAQIRDGCRHIWVGEGVQGFSHDSLLAAATICCSEVSLHFLHFSGELVRCSRTKVNYAALQVSAPSLEVGLGFGIQDWLVSGILTYVLLELLGLTLVPVSRVF